jgi:hypothetical protein
MVKTFPLKKIVEGTWGISSAVVNSSGTGEISEDSGSSFSIGNSVPSRIDPVDGDPGVHAVRKKIRTRNNPDFCNLFFIIESIKLINDFIENQRQKTVRKMLMIKIFIIFEINSA